MTLPDVIPLSWKIGAAVALCGALWGAYGLWHHHVDKGGYDRAEAFYLKREAKATADATEAKLNLDNAVKLKQAELDSALSKLSSKEKEYRDEQAKSNTYQRALAAGAVRMRVLTSTNPNCSAGKNQGGVAASVDNVSETLADLPPRIAANLDRLRSNENEAIRRLDACVDAYEAVRAAANAP